MSNNLKVVIVNEDKEEVNTYMHSPRDRVLTVRRALAADMNVNTDTIVLCNNKHIIPDDWILAEVGETHPRTVYLTMTITTALSDLVDGVLVRISLPSGIYVWHKFGPDDTPADVLGLLRRAGQVISIKDLRTSRGSLITGARWMHRRLSDCGVRSGEDLMVDAEEIQEVQVNLRSPAGNENKVYSVCVALGQCTLQAIATQMELVLGHRFDDSDLFLQFGCYYERELQVVRCTDSLRKEEGVSDLCDEENSKEFTPTGDWHQVEEFLAAGSEIRAVVGRPPVISVLRRSVIVCLDSSDSSEFVELERKALFAPQYLALIELLLLRDRRRGHLNWFIELARGYGDCQTRQFAGKSERAVAMTQQSVPEVDQQWNRYLLLLRHNDLLPKFNVVSGETVAVFVRDKVTLSVVGNRIKRQGLNHRVCGSTWTLLRSGSEPGRFGDFETAFTRAMSN